MWKWFIEALKKFLKIIGIDENFTARILGEGLNTNKNTI